MNVTIFKNFQDVSNPYTIPIGSALKRIKEGSSKELICSIREGNGDKKLLPCILFSAAKVVGNGDSFRRDASVVEHSGFFTLDFDKIDTHLKLEQLRKDPYIYAAWLSATGNGVRALVKCPPSIPNHPLYYTAFLDRYPELDSTSRNIARIAFESWDPEIYINENSLVWDKKLTEEQRRNNKTKEQNRRGTQVLSIAVGMVRASYDGIKHESLLKAANLVGGYIAAGRVNEEEAVKVLEDEIRAKNPSDFHGAQTTIRDGIRHGKSRPLLESKKIEKAQQLLRREDGTYDFLASNEEMTEYELSVINGTLEMGLPTGLNGLNKHWMFKKHHLVFFIGSDNSGKSFVLWYLSILAAKFHGWKFILHSAENRDGGIRKKLKEFYLGKSIKLMDDEELTKAHEFVQEHYRIISSKQMHTVEDFLIKCELLIDEGFEATVVIGEPWNSFDIPSNMDSYRNNLHALNLLRVFKENYCSVWVADHVNTAATRAKDEEGYPLAPDKYAVEMGAMKNNKTDEAIILHRLGTHPFKKRELQIHVQKIRDEETGGSKTDKGVPVIIEMETDYCGYKSNGINPIKYE